MTGPRLPWQRRPEGGFVAFPEGEDAQGRFATLTPHTARTGAWYWRVVYDGASLGNLADSSQEASDAANDAWPAVIAKAEELATHQATEQRRLALLDAAEGEADPDLSPFAISTADRDTLLWLITRASKRPRAKGLDKLIAALSAELYKFRTGERIE